jgi:hypothetical protein
VDILVSKVGAIMMQSNQTALFHKQWKNIMKWEAN